MKELGISQSTFERQDMNRYVHTADWHPLASASDHNQDKMVDYAAQSSPSFLVPTLKNLHKARRIPRAVIDAKVLRRNLRSTRNHQ